MKVEYFGTSLNEKGHYLVDLGKEGIGWEKSLDLKKFPFNVYSFTRNQPYGYINKTTVEDYKIIAIAGSCIDTRGGCTSVFITREEKTLEEFEKYLKEHPYVQKMFEKMPFELQW